MKEKSDQARMEHLRLVTDEAGEASLRPLSMAWISDELLAKTKAVWTKAYGRNVDEDEAIEILLNVKHAAETILKAKREMKTS